MHTSSIELSMAQKGQEGGASMGEDAPNLV